MDENLLCSTKEASPSGLRCSLAKSIPLTNKASLVPLPPPKGLVLHLCLSKCRMWDNGSPIRVGFLNGSTRVQQKTIEYASLWFEHPNLRLEVVPVEEAAVRISYSPGHGTWSYVGTDCLHVQNHQEATMYLELYDWTAEHVFKRTVLHEFGHVLGCLHEHQCPATGI
jgi:hypothetical protein